MYALIYLWAPRPPGGGSHSVPVGPGLLFVFAAGSNGERVACLLSRIDFDLGKGRGDLVVELVVGLRLRRVWGMMRSREGKGGGTRMVV